MGTPRAAGFVLAIAAGLALTLATAKAQAQQEITATSFGEMNPVVFDHTAHAEAHGCGACHHVKHAGGAHRCGSCHLANDTGAAMKFEDAAHKEGVGRCWACHLKAGARARLECEGCHRGKPKWSQRRGRL